MLEVEINGIGYLVIIEVDLNISVNDLVLHLGKICFVEPVVEDIGNARQSDSISDPSLINIALAHLRDSACQVVIDSYRTRLCVEIICGNSLAVLRVSTLVRRGESIENVLAAVCLGSVGFILIACLSRHGVAEECISRGGIHIINIEVAVRIGVFTAVE